MEDFEMFVKSGNSEYSFIYKGLEIVMAHGYKN